jgi:hypothetical protein
MFLLLVLFASVGSASFMVGRKIGHALRDRHRKVAQLPSADRTLLTLQVGDVVQQLDRDYLVEGAVLLSEAPRAARLCRIIDGSLERFVYATTESEEAWLLETAEPPEGRPNELPTMRLERRWQASTLSTGRMGPRAFDAELSIHEYVGGDRLLLVLDGPGRVVAFLGNRLLPHAVDILPGRGR